MSGDGRLSNGSVSTMSAGGVIVSARGRIAVVSQVTDSVSLPKGHVNEGEPPYEAAVREIYEETGLRVSAPWRVFPAYRRMSGRHANETKTIVMFLFVLTDEPEMRPLDPENPGARWVTPEDAICSLTYAEDRVFLESVLSDVRALSNASLSQALADEAD